jgi:hypothetical protein
MPCSASERDVYFGGCLQDLERLEARADQTKMTWVDIRAGRIRFASEDIKVAKLEGAWIRWKDAVADLNAYRNNVVRRSVSN